MVAQISRTAIGSRLEFEPEMLANPPGFPGFLATTLPYSTYAVEVQGDNLHPFFINLLPEGARQQALFERRRMSRDDFLSLLLEVGSDTIGDVAVVRPGETPSEKSTPKIDPHEAVFDELFQQELERGRTSIPGVQEKISEATISFPVRTANDASILKLNPLGFPRLVQNEAFFMRMAARCGLRTAKTALVADKLGVEGLLVQRFDRGPRRKGMPVEKYHQEDGCQILNTVPSNKYSGRFPSMNLGSVAKAMSGHATSPSSLVAELIQQYAFSWMIGNADMHAKNVSLQWRGGLVTLTPAYDIASTLPYKGYDRNMALAMDGKDGEFKFQDFVRFGERHGVPKEAVGGGLARVTQRASAFIPRLHEIGFDAETTEKLAREIEERRQRLIP